MTAIILPDRWRKQPRHLVRTRGHFAHGIVWSAGGGVYSAHGKALTLAGVSHVTTDGHHAFSTDGATGDNIDLSAFPETPPPWTYLIRLRRRADQQDARLHTPISGSSVAVLSCNVGGSTTLDILDSGSAWEPIGSMADVFPVGVMRTLVVSMSATKDVKAYAFGKVVGSTTIASSSYLNLGGAAYIGGIYAGLYGATVQFDVAEIGLTSGAITEGEAIALSFATYGELFVKDPRVLYFEMAGGTNYTLPLDSGSFTLSGQASSLAHNKILSLAEGSFTLSGSSADLLSNKVLSLEQGSFNVSGQTADLLHNKLLSLENGSFTVTDSDATLLFNRLLELGVGSVTLSGSDATLTYTHGSTYSLVLSEGTFSLGGGSATLVHNKVIPLDSGVFTLSGSDINLIHGKNLTLEAGSFTLSGNDLTFLYNRALPLFSGSITISGGSSTLSYSGVPTISILESLKSYIETQRELKSKITIEIDLKSLL